MTEYQKVACPECTASAGFPCRDEDEVHPERVTLYEASRALAELLVG